jgi:Flp pilus assembly protein TadG
MAAKNPFRCLSAGEQGSSLVEMAVALPTLFMFMFCFMEMCLAFYSFDMISEAAREGARYAMVHGAGCPNSTNPTCEATATQVNTYVSSLVWPNLAGGTITPNTTYPDGDEAVGHRVQVEVTYSFSVTMPFVPKKTISMTSTSQMKIIQ